METKLEKELGILFKKGTFKKLVSELASIVYDFITSSTKFKKKERDVAAKHKEITDLLKAVLVELKKLNSSKLHEQEEISKGKGNALGPINKD